MAAMERIAKRVLPSDVTFEWSAMSYQEKITGNQLYYVFGLSVLLVYLCLAGQYESWILPLAVLSAVPLALVGPVLALTSLGAAQQPLHADRPDAADRAVGEERHSDRRGGAGTADHRRQADPGEAAVDASRTRFRPILMTSFAFILGVLPLVLATGAGANARRSLGISVFSGMIASTCLAVLFVPSFFVVLQRFEEWRKSRKKPEAAPTGPAELAPRPRRKGRLRRGREAGATKERPLLANSFRTRTDQEHQGVDVNRSPGRHWSGRFLRN